MKKILLYRKAIVEVNDNGETYLSAISWHKYFATRILLFFKMMEFEQPFCIRFVWPWEIAFTE